MQSVQKVLDYRLFGVLGRCAPYTVTHEAATDWTCERHALTVYIHVLCNTVYENML